MVLKALKEIYCDISWKIFMGNILKGFLRRNEYSTPLLCRWKIISVMTAQHYRRSFSSLKVGETSKKLCFSSKLFWVNGFWFKLQRYDLIY